MTFEDEIEVLERRLAGYQANYDFAVKNANNMRTTRYRDIIRKAKIQIKELEKTAPNVAIQRLQDKITDLHIKIDELANKELLSKLRDLELQKQINDFAKPIPEPEPEQKPIPEIIPEVEVIPEPEEILETETEPIPELEPEPEVLEEKKDEIIETKLKCTCGKEFETERGLRTHQSRFCTKKEKVKIS